MSQDHTSPARSISLSNASHLSINDLVVFSPFSMLLLIVWPCPLPLHHYFPSLRRDSYRDRDYRDRDSSYRRSDSSSYRDSYRDGRDSRDSYRDVGRDRDRDRDGYRDSYRDRDKDSYRSSDKDRKYDSGSRDYDRGSRDLDRVRDYDRGSRDYDRGSRDYDRGSRDLDRGSRDYDRGSSRYADKDYEPLYDIGRSSSSKYDSRARSRSPIRDVYRSRYVTKETVLLKWQNFRKRFYTTVVPLVLSTPLQ